MIAISIIIYIGLRTHTFSFALRDSASTYIATEPRAEFRVTYHSAAEQ